VADVREPYATLFAGFDDHWVFGEHLDGDEPNWAGLATDPRIESISVGEKVLLDFAHAYANCLIYLDADNLARVRAGLREALR
jgi:hypothetical protein